MFYRAVGYENRLLVIRPRLVVRVYCNKLG